MAAHRYWRLLLGRRSGAAALVTDIQLCTVVGGSNAASGGTAISSTPGAGTAANAFDGSVVTSFTSQVSDPVYIGYDFGASNSPSIVEVALSIGSTAATTPYSFILQYSDDNTTWISIANYDVSNAATGSTTYYSGFPATPKARASFYSARYDTVDGGNYRIAGIVTIKGPPDTIVMRRVYLYERITRRVVRSVWSDPVTGAYKFENIKFQAYYLEAVDYPNYYNLAVKDNVIPILMP